MAAQAGAGNAVGLFIGGLAPTVTESVLQQVFDEIGVVVTSLRIASDRESGKSKGYAFVDLAGSGEDAEFQGNFAIHRIHNEEICGRTITAQLQGFKGAGKGGGGAGKPVGGSLNVSGPPGGKGKDTPRPNQPTANSFDDAVRRAMQAAAATVGGRAPQNVGQQPVGPDGPVYQGVVKAFIQAKNYGFIACAETHAKYGLDCFMQKTEFDRSGAKPGSMVSFTVWINPKNQPQAGNVKVLPPGCMSSSASMLTGGMVTGANMGLPGGSGGRSGGRQRSRSRSRKRKKKRGRSSSSSRS